MLSIQILGALFGSIACLEALAGLIGAIVFNLIYKSTIPFYTGFAYWVLGFVTAVGCVLLG